MGTTYKRIEAVRKTGEILKYMANQKMPVTGAEIAKAVGLAAGTCMCHLATLEDAGFVETVGGDRYMIGRQIGLFWARVKANLEAQRDRIERDLDEINPDNYKE